MHLLVIMKGRLSYAIHFKAASKNMTGFYIIEK